MDKLNQKQIKIENSRLILTYISQLGETSRSDLSKLTKLSRPTVSTLVEDLLKQNYIIEKGRGVSRGGKRPTLLEINTQSAYFLSIDFSDWKNIYLTVMNPVGDVVYEQRNELTVTTDKILDRIIDLIHSVSDKYGESLKAVIFPVRGVLNKEKTEIIEKVDPPLENRFFEKIAEGISLPVYLERNAHAAAFGEWTLNYSKYNEFIYLSLGKGLSSGIIIDGKLYRGSLMAAGEIAHIHINSDGPLCTCGNSGCIEAILSESHIASLFSDRMNEKVEESDIYSLFDDPANSQPIIEYLAVETAKALRIIIELLNIPKITLGGRFSNFGDDFLRHLTKELYQENGINILKYFEDDISIKYSETGKDMTAVGAGFLLIDKYLNFNL